MREFEVRLSLKADDTESGEPWTEQTLSDEIESWMEGINIQVVGSSVERADKLPKCELCADMQGEEGFPVQDAEFIAAQSEDRGKTVTWVRICRMHADGWNREGDWEAPIYRIGERIGE